MAREVPHLLVVDDDERLRALLGRFLRRSGFLVTLAADAGRARNLLAGLVFDLVVLDVMMPGEDGVSLCRDLRRRLSTPILLLTARGETGDRIAGLEAGADDYLAKPFDPKELLLRIGAVLRRAGAPGGGDPEPAAGAPAGGSRRMLRLGAVRYDVERGELVADGPAEEGGPRLHLTATEAELMRVLAAAPGTTVTRARLIEEVGRSQRGGLARGGEGGDLAALAQERAVDVQITRLRRKIEPDPRQPRYLQTVRGEGYRLSPD